MSDATKVLVVWASKASVDRLQGDDGSGPTTIGTVELAIIHSRIYGDADRRFLLLPIEDGALRVGEYLFRRETDPETSWYEADPRDLYDLLMDAVEGVEP